MTTVVAALNRIARQCSVTPPNAWSTATRLEHVELRDDFLYEAIEEIQDRIDLPSPIGKQTTITGTGVAEYSLPANFRRMARDPLAVYELTTLRRAGTPVSWDGAWTHLGTIGTAGSFRYYKIEGYPGAYTISFEQELATGNEVTVSYVSNNWVVDSTSAESDEFDDEADILMLPRRVVELGTIFRFRMRKGLTYADWHAKYESELARLGMDSRNIRVVSFGSAGDDYKPMRVPVPDSDPERLMRSMATQRPVVAERLPIPASRAGWVQNASMADPPPQSAEVLDNFFPTSQGLRLRRGSNLHATLADDVVQVMSYAGGGTEKLFAAEATKIYDVTSPADPEVPPAAAVSSLTSGDWSYINFGASGNFYLVLANGADSVREFDGATWTTPTITGVTSADLTHVWEFGSRLFFIEKDTLSAWYLAAESISGAATEFPLSYIFSRGGSLLFGARWSLGDSGSGQDDLCVFVTTKGEVAVYTGTDPASASTFTLQGVYQIAPPLSKHAAFRAGGDLAIVTEDGIVSLASAAQNDRSAVSRTAITYPIEDAWREAVTLRTASHRFNTTLWHSKTMLLVSVPNDYTATKQAFVANVRTGGWCRYTNWDVQCSAVYNDRLFFGTSSNTVIEAEVTGGDEGAPYTGYWLPKFVQLGGSHVSLMSGRISYKGNIELSPEITGAMDYDTSLPQPPAQGTDETSDVWGTGIWGTAVWGGSSPQAVTTEWQSVAGNGFAPSSWVAATSARTTAPDAEVISLELLYERGNVI